MRIIYSTNKNFYIKASAKYFFDKGIYFMLLNLIPCLMIPFFISPSSSLYFLLSYDQVANSSLGTLLTLIFDAPLTYWYVGVIGIVLLIFTLSFTVGAIDRHMRIGDFTFSLKTLTFRLDNNILAVFLFCVIAFAFMEVLNIITVLFYFLWAKVFKNIVAWTIVSCVTCLITVFLTLYLVVHSILWPPFMLHAGLRPLDAYKKAWSSISGQIFKSILLVFISILPIDIVMIFTGIFCPSPQLRVILDAIAYVLVIPMFIINMYVIFYDVTGTERMDLNKEDEHRIITRW